MLKKSLKYLAVAIVNSILLTILLALWTDQLELTYHTLVRPIEFLKIILACSMSLIAMRILVSYCRRKNIVTVHLKIKIATLLTFLISSYLYVDYSSKVIDNRLINGRFRQQIANKVMPTDGPEGTQADHLTISEYQQIEKLTWFPSLPEEASDIKYKYQFDGFLPDYLFVVEYDVPEQFQVDTINEQKKRFSRYQSFKLVNAKKRVVYEEIQQ